MKAFTNQNNWSERYFHQIERNIGYITVSEQELLKTTPVAVLGVGGLGGPLAEQLVRSGCEHLIICDHDTFERSNLNRQICTEHDMGDYKVDTLENHLQTINPDIDIKKFYQIDTSSIDYIVHNVSIVTLTLDGPISSIMIARACRKNKISMLESWVIPYLWSWWFTPESLSYEECYGLDTLAMSIEQIKTSKIAHMGAADLLFSRILTFPGVKELYDREKGAFNATVSRKIGIRSLAPLVRLTASYLAFELIYAGILNVKQKVLAPQIIGYDYFRMNPIEFKMI